MPYSFTNDRRDPERDLAPAAGYVVRADLSARASPLRGKEFAP
jgi:hypothetical protein